MVLVSQSSWSLAVPIESLLRGSACLYCTDTGAAVQAMEYKVSHMWITLSRKLKSNFFISMEDMLYTKELNGQWDSRDV